MDAIKALDNLSKALQNPRKLKTIGGMAREIIRGHIHKGQSMKPLAPATVAYRGKGKPLQDTGSLRDSITFSYIDERTVSVGTNKPYARLQNNGGVIRPKNKNWLWIPGPKTRQLQRRYGYSPTDVLKGLKADGFSIFRMGRTMRYWKKGKKPPKDSRDYPVAYYLKKSVEIPARPFFYLTAEEMALITEEVGLELKQF
ncbi:MAG: phage virion morphogenesis protein [Treponema sp.]|jgi:phage gpG-like protein|nr:phage virion morphogenesis protein [Treponema sp.]